ncbi:MAG: hypothetical protein AAFW70_11505 [Cyanobacteria bacterium J06635_10]
MSNILWKSLALSPAVFGATLLVSTTAIAAANTTDSEAVKASLSQTEKSETKASSVFSASVEPQGFPQYIRHRSSSPHTLHG